MNKFDLCNQKQPSYVIRWVDEIKNCFWDKICNCLTGIRPSWRLHLWHYKWALETWLKMQELPNIQNNFLIADYQVLGDYLGDVDRLRNSVIDMVIDWLAIWLDPEKSNFIIQSYVPEFSELFNLLTMFTPYNTVISNPTLKDEINKIKNRTSKYTATSVGFLNYPISQVADIMLLKWEAIPVWEDQLPHIELARNLIKKINNIYNTSFPVPVAILSSTPRLIGTDWNDKMSKSLWNTIGLTSSLDEIKKSVHSMYTDPGKTSVHSPWNVKDHVVFKYLDIFYEDKDHIDDLKKRYIEWGTNSVWDWELKKLLTDVLNNLIASIREKRQLYQENIPLVISAFEKWSEKARNIWQKVLEELKENLGIINYGKEKVK